MRLLASLLAAASLAFVAPAYAKGPAQAPAAAKKAEPAAKGPAVLALPRPKGGEWLGIYLLGKKAGWAFSDVKEGTFEGKPAVVAVNEMVLKATVGGAQTTREIHEERFYEFKDGGRLIGFRTDIKGDGQDQTLLGDCRPDGIVLTRMRQDGPTEEKKLPPTVEVVENADSVRWVASTGKKLEAMTFDSMEKLADERSTTEVVAAETFTAAGVKVPVVVVKSLEEKSATPVLTKVTKDGRTLEVKYGEVMIGRVEEEKVAKQLDQVDIFALTRVVLDKAIPDTARNRPGQVSFLVRGLPDAYRIVSDRQKFTPRGDAVALTITAQPPAKSVARPVAAGESKELADALKATVAIDSDSADVAELAKRTVGEEKDAWAAARKLNLLVNRLLDKSYGASSDRASDVLNRKKGDCTEHALLFTALARAAGIPARRVDGLVYMMNEDGVPALYWHEWSEVWVGQWIATDPTFGQPVADATHVAVGGEETNDSAALIGQLKMTVLDAQALEAPKPEAAKPDSPKPEAPAPKN